MAGDELDPKILSQELAALLNDAVTLLHLHGQRVLTPEMLLLAFLRTPGCAAQKILARFAQGRGFDLPALEGELEAGLADRALVADRLRLVGVLIGRRVEDLGVQSAAGRVAAPGEVHGSGGSS